MDRFVLAHSRSGSIDSAFTSICKQEHLTVSVQHLTCNTQHATIDAERLGIKGRGGRA